MWQFGNNGLVYCVSFVDDKLSCRMLKDLLNVTEMINNKVNFSDRYIFFQGVNVIFRFVDFSHTPAFFIGFITPHLLTVCMCESPVCHTVYVQVLHIGLKDQTQVARPGRRCPHTGHPLLFISCASGNGV